MTLVELLQMLSYNNSSGALHVTADSNRMGIAYFDNGLIVGAQEQDREALTLGHVLQQLQMASQQQMELVFQKQTQDALGKRIGQRLIDERFITPQQLERALRTQTLWTIRELSLWKRGEYAFHAGERMPTDAIAPSSEVTAVGLEALRYQHVWDTLEPTLPDGMRTYLLMATEPPLDHPLQFHPAAWRIISRVNTQRTVRRIATALRTPELEVAQMVGPLVREGLLRPARVGAAPGLPAEAERMNLAHFDLLTLLVSMEQDWLKRKTTLDRLVALTAFINQTMETLENTYRAADVGLSPETLADLLAREGITGLDGYPFLIARNRINTDDFAAFLRRAYEGGMPPAAFEQRRLLLQRALEAAFFAINARVMTPSERSQNQEAWEALFMSFASEPT